MENFTVEMVGVRIKEIRLSKKIKLIDLAILAEVSKGLISKIENHKTVPSLPVLFKIIKALEETPRNFFS